MKPPSRVIARALAAAIALTACSMPADAGPSPDSSPRPPASPAATAPLPTGSPAARPAAPHQPPTIVVANTSPMELCYVATGSGRVPADRAQALVVSAQIEAQIGVAATYMNMRFVSDGGYTGGWIKVFGELQAGSTYVFSGIPIAAVLMNDSAFWDSRANWSGRAEYQIVTSDQAGETASTSILSVPFRYSCN